jgi:hypothetical protein
MIIIVTLLLQAVRQVVWHGRGDYLAVTSADGEAIHVPSSTFTVASHWSCDPRGCSPIDLLIFDLIFTHTATGSDVIIHHLSKARSQVRNCTNPIN